MTWHGVHTLMRLVGGRRLVLLSYSQLSAERGRALIRAVEARRNLERVAADATQDRQVADGLDEHIRRAQEVADEVKRINQEMRRRARLSACRRAEEDAVRSEMAGETLRPAHLSVIPQRLAAVPSARRRAHEDEWQVHRPGQVPGSHGVPR